MQPRARTIATPDTTHPATVGRSFRACHPAAPIRYPSNSIPMTPVAGADVAEGRHNWPALLRNSLVNIMVPCSSFIATQSQYLPFLVSFFPMGQTGHGSWDASHQLAIAACDAPRSRKLE